MKKIILLTGMLGALFMFTNNVNAQVTSNQSLTMGIPEVLLIAAVNEAGVAGAVSLELTTTTAGTVNAFLTTDMVGWKSYAEYSTPYYSA